MGDGGVRFQTSRIVAGGAATGVAAAGGSVAAAAAAAAAIHSLILRLGFFLEVAAAAVDFELEAEAADEYSNDVAAKRLKMLERGR